MILQSSLVNPVVIHMVFFLECGWGKRSCLLRCSRVRCLAGCFHVSARLDKLRARAHESDFRIGEHELQFLELGLLAFACVLQLSNTVFCVHRLLHQLVLQQHGRFLDAMPVLSCIGCMVYRCFPERLLGCELAIARHLSCGRTSVCACRTCLSRSETASFRCVRCGASSTNYGPRSHRHHEARSLALQLCASVW